MRQRFVTEQWLPFSRAVVFAFFADPRNLPPLMPAWQRARIVDATLVPPPPAPEGMRVGRGIYAGSGTTLQITARLGPGMPVRVPWLARIEDFRWGEGFCDLQVKGPFAYWRHCHSVQAERGGTTVRDDVEYELPLAAISWVGAPLGALAMRTIFKYRQRRAAVLLASFAVQSG